MRWEYLGIMIIVWYVVCMYVGSLCDVCMYASVQRLEGVPRGLYMRKEAWRGVCSVRRDGHGGA